MTEIINLEYISLGNSPWAVQEDWYNASIIYSFNLALKLQDWTMPHPNLYSFLGHIQQTKTDQMNDMQHIQRTADKTH